MTMHKVLKYGVGLFLLFAVAVDLTSIKHPIILKWLSGSARRIGKPIQATVYLDGQIDTDVKVYYVDRYWGSSEKANNYLLALVAHDSLGRLKYVNINLNEKWIGSPVGTSNKDYDIILGHLFQSETGGHFTPFQNNIKGFSFDPQLSFTDRQIKFNIPTGTLKFDSVRIEIE